MNNEIGLFMTFMVAFINCKYFGREYVGQDRLQKTLNDRHRLFYFVRKLDPM